MGLIATKAARLTEAGASTVVEKGGFLRTLHRVIVNSGASGATVTLQYADTNETFAVIDASKPDIGRVFMLRLGKRGLKAVVVGTPDVTVTWS